MLDSCYSSLRLGWERLDRRLSVERNVRLVLLIGGGLSLALWIVLAVITRGLPDALVDSLVSVSPGPFRTATDQLRYGFWYEVDNSNMPTLAFLGLQLSLWGILGGLSFVVIKYQVGKGGLWIILMGALLFRLVLLFSVPIHENDYYRYFWDGKSTAHGVNPYLYEPAALYLYEFDVRAPMWEPATGTLLRGRPWSEADAQLLDRLIDLRNENPEFYYRIGHWQVPTIYPPIAQAVFLVSHLFFGDSLTGFRVVFMGFDLGCIALILALLRRFHRPVAQVIIYAWSPLVLVELTNSAHYDAIPVFFMLLGIWLAMSARKIGSMLSLAASGLSKLFGFFLAPILYPPDKARSYLYYALGALTFMLGYLPFLLWQDGAWSQVFGGLQTYARDWQNNSGLFLVVDGILGVILPAARDSYWPAKQCVALGYLVFLLWTALRPTPNSEGLLRKCYWAIAVFFVLSPTAFPWYFIWVLPFICIWPRPSWFLLMQLLSIYYLDFHTEYAIVSAQLMGIPLMNWLTWVPFALVWGMETYLNSRNSLSTASS